MCGHRHQRVRHSIGRRDGRATRVEVLSDEYTIGSAVVLDLADLSVEPLQEAWSRESGR